MLESLKLINLAPHTPFDQLALERRGFFILSTCQRILVLGMDETKNLKSENLHSGTLAYEYALEVITGLKGIVKAESEIMAQFRGELQKYISSAFRNTRLLRILEKLSKDAKEIRFHYLKNIPTQSYASVSRLLLKKENTQSKNVLILGSGKLAQDVIHQLKKTHNLWIMARNTQRLQLLATTHNLNIFDWNNSDIPNEVFPVVINTIPEIDQINRLLQNKKLLINYSTNKITSSQSKIYNLEQILEMLEQNNKNSTEKIHYAKLAIGQLAIKRTYYFQKESYNILNASKRIIENFL